MTADKPTNLLPKLRFPEFQSRRDWQYTMLGSVLKEHGLKSDGTSEVHSVSLGKGIVLQVEHMGRSFAASNTTHYNLVQSFDLVYTRSPLANFKLGIVKQHKGVHNAIVSPLYGVFRPRNRHLGLMIETYFDSPSRSIQFLDPLAQKGAKNTIQLSNDRFLSGALYLPEDADEQQRIADCFGSLDDLIAAEDRKLEALRGHKQGLMQQLFPQPGETVPRLRFPEFREDPEWEEKKLGDVAEVLMCKRIFASQTNPNGGVPFYKIGTLGGMPDAFISKDLFEEYKLNYNFPRTGEILITCSGTIGKCLPYDGNDAYFQDSNIVWIDNPTHEVSNEFLLSILSNVDWSTLNSTTITRIYGPDLRNLVIKFPQNEKEQQCISDSLCPLDDLIAAEGRKLEALRQHKQGLQQQLFPSLEAESR